MKGILRIRRGVKVRRATVRKICELPLKQIDMNIKAELIQAWIPIGFWHVKEVLEEEVRQFARRDIGVRGYRGMIGY